MPLYVLLAYVALAAAAVLLALDAWPGGRRLGSRWRTLRMAVYGAASIVGTTLLTALSGGEALLAAALVPLTAVSVLRFERSLALSASGWQRVGWTALVLAVGVTASLQVVPVPLTRDHLSPGPTSTRTAPETIRPYADQPVRV